MTPYLIGADELDALAAGRPSVVSVAGMPGLDTLPLAVLLPRNGVLRRIGTPEGMAVPLPPEFRPLAILAPDSEAANGLASGLPPGIPLLVSDNPLPALLTCLAEAMTAPATAKRGVTGQPPHLPLAPQPAPDLIAEMANGADFQDLKLYQYSINTNGSYRHLDFGLIGLGSASGIWREARLKLFDRRGTVGLEFRSLKGWPKLFDPWPGEFNDQFGPFWRLETQGVLKALLELGSSQNGAVVAAILAVLPDAARHAAALAGEPEPEQEAWSARGRAPGAMVAAALRPETTASTPS
jgi:hypothetical protein